MTRAVKPTPQSGPSVPSDFRADINALRAVAVMAVLLFHFEMPGFGGGFVGVDIFFVISGFLMTGIVTRGLQGGRFSLLQFWAARTRRIVPALTLVCLCLACAGWLVLLPTDYAPLGKHILGSLTFVSNFAYWGEAGYFDTASHEKWLLHTWSLSVEWQYYLLMPAAALLLWRLRPRVSTLQAATLAGLVGSYLLCVWLTPVKPIAAFFLLPTRAWEMLLGGWIFLSPSTARVVQTWPRLAGVIGMFMVGLSVLLMGTAPAWPGAWAAVPAVGTAVLLALNAQPAGCRHAVVQWLGDRSYSIYLWHWPIWVALGFLELRHNATALLLAMSAVLVLSELSYRLVEAPARRWSAAWPAPQLLVRAGLGALPVLLAAGAIWAAEGVSGRLPARVEQAGAEALNINPRRGECLAMTGLTSPRCLYGGPVAAVAVFGDSHANALLGGLVQARPRGDQGILEVTYAACTPASGLRDLPSKRLEFGDGYRCGEFIEQATAALKELPPTVPIVIIARYARAAFGSNDGGAIDRRPEVTFAPAGDAPAAQLTQGPASSEFLQTFGARIVDLACTLAQAHPVHLVRPIPEMGLNVPRVAARKLAMGSSTEVSMTWDAYWQRNAWVWHAQDQAAERCGVRVLDPTQVLCRAGRCYATESGKPLYADHGHLSEWGNRKLTPMFRDVFTPRDPRP